jgi:hypothetical protein
VQGTVKGRLVGGAYSGSREIRHISGTERWRGTSDDAPHVRLHRHSAPGDLSVSRLEPRRVEVLKVSHAHLPHTLRLCGKMKKLASRTYKYEYK